MPFEIIPGVTAAVAACAAANIPLTHRNEGQAVALVTGHFDPDSPECTLDWDGLARQLDAQGFATTGQVFSADECRELAGLFDGDGFRSTIDMARHRFGEGRYRYFAHPLPEPIQVARVALYERLAAVANAWSQRLSGDTPTFPSTHAELLERCRAAGQERPTPLLLRYHEGDWNALHQDLYGEVYFPFQAVTVLSDLNAEHFYMAIEAYRRGLITKTDLRFEATSLSLQLPGLSESRFLELAEAAR